MKHEANAQFKQVPIHVSTIILSRKPMNPNIENEKKSRIANNNYNLC